MENETGMTTRQVQLTPTEVLEGATEQSKLLMNIVEQTKCYQVISGKKYLQVEAWETIGAFNRTHAETENVSPIIKDGETIGYQAHVQLWKDGNVVGGAVMPCFFTENCCKGKDGDAKHKSAMSAAQTFATSKAYRMNFSYIAILAGFQPMPAEEITTDMAEPVDKTEHWCFEHGAAFFKKGKMRSFAHPIKDDNGDDTGDWCHEHVHKKEEAEQDIKDLWPGDPQPTPEAVRSKSSPLEGEVIVQWSHLPNMGSLLTRAKNYDMPRSEVYAELRIESPNEIADPDEAWLKIAQNPKHNFKPAEA